MEKKQRIVTPEMLREAYIANLKVKRKPNANMIADFTEKELANFIRQYADANFKGIYAETDHNYYDRIISQIPLNQEMKATNEAAELRYSSHQKLYSMFLESKHFKQLFKRRISGHNEQKPSSGTTSPSTQHGPQKPKEREMTEGEKKHVEFEIAHRNPKPWGLTDRAIQSIDDVTNPLLNSINEKCARIRKVFLDVLGTDLAAYYYIKGERGELKKIALPQDLIIWE